MTSSPPCVSSSAPGSWAAGPFLAGVLSDLWGLQQAMAVIPVFSLFAAGFFALAARSYEHDMQRVEDVAMDAAPPTAMPAIAAA